MMSKRYGGRGAPGDERMTLRNDRRKTLRIPRQTQPAKVYLVMGLICVSWVSRCEGRQIKSAYLPLTNLGSCCGSKNVRFIPSSYSPVGKIHSRSDVDTVPSSRQALFMSSEIRNEDSELDLISPPSNRQDEDLSLISTEKDAEKSWLKDIISESPLMRFLNVDGDEYKKPPPLQVEDTSLLFYDVCLLLNLTMSISFWVVHRLSFDYIGSAVSEGSLMCILWIAAGLFNGAFLYSAVDGHYGSMDERAGPKAAGLLGLHTFIGVCNLRVLVALVMAVVEHRPVGQLAGEQLIPLEILFGLMLMSAWRALHSFYAPRV